MNRSSRRFVVTLAALVMLAAAGLSPATAQVVINELHYNPPGDDATVLLEFVELHNSGAAAVDIGAWKLRFGPEDFVFPLGTTIAAGAHLVVAENQASLATATGHTAAFEWYGLDTGLSNGGETVLLLNPSFAIVDSVAYDDDPPWTTAPDGNNPSLELVNPTLDNNLGTSWNASIPTNGTPGAQNSVYSDAPRVANEVPRRKSAVETLSSISVTFSTSVSGVTPDDLTVEGSPATGVSCPTCVGGVGAGPYEFTGFAAPSPGSTTIALASGGIQAGVVAFAGDSWTVSAGLVVVLNEIHYHPPDAVADVEFVEVHNAGSATADLSGWTVSDGLNMLFPPATSLPPGGFVVIALNPTLLQSVTGYSGALAWTSGRLSNSGERLALADADGNELDVVDFGDGGVWPVAADGDGPSIELLNPRLPNDYGSAWRASLVAHGTPGALNGTYDPAPKPIIAGVLHSPAIPAPLQSITVVATVLDDAVIPTVTLYYRQDQDPTIAYSSTPMYDDGAHGDGAAGDRVFGAVLPGLAEGQRLDFTIRADDGTGSSAAPPGHNTLVAGQYPAQTYLCEFTASAVLTDFPMYRLITTQRTRNLQEAHNEDEHDATFLRCNPLGCEIFYNVIERYRGQSSLNQHPHSYRVNFPADHPLQSEMGFEITRLNLMSQATDKQHLGYQFFREAFGGTIPTPKTQFARFHTNPLSHGGVQDYVYVNVERLDDDFLESQNGDITPTRFPDRCSIGGQPCDADSDCGAGETCVATDSGNLYRGRLSGDLQYHGTNPDSYRGSYDKETNAEADDWTDLIDQCYALDPDTTSEAAFEIEIEEIADEEEWARWFAIHMLLVNQEGGIYRDTGDDYYLYFEPEDSPLGHNSKFLPWDLDSVFGGFGSNFNQETIWRTNVQTTQRFVRSNSFAGRFVGAICELLDTDFTTAVLYPRIDALPAAVANASRKTALKNFVVARRNYVNAEIRRQLTMTGVPASPYTDPNPVIAVSGQLNQCGTRTVTVNGLPANFSVYAATWSANVTLTPGPNTIVVRDLDHAGNEIDRVEQSVTYAPPGSQPQLRLTVPDRMLADRTLTIKAERIDSLGRIKWEGCPAFGTVSARRLSDGSNVPITITTFDSHISLPADSIRFYSGVGSVSFTLDQGAAFPAGDIEVRVDFDGVYATKLVTVESAPTFRSLSGTLSGAGLTWGPDENIRITGNVTVPGGTTLSILPGTLVMVNTTGSLNNGTLITVNGTVQAIGTEDRPIHFFSERGPAAMSLTQSGSASNANSWQGIFHEGTGSSRYEWVILTGAGNGQVISHPRPPILRFNSGHSFVMDHSTLVDNNGMALAGPGTGRYTLRNTLVSRCGIGAEFNGNGHTLLIEDSWWSSCGWAPEPANLDGDLMHIDGSASNQTIRRSIFADGGDDGIDHSGSTYTAENIIIYGILDKAVSMTGGFGNFRNTLIYGSGTGIRGSASCENCTIAVGAPIASPNSVQESIIWSSSLNTCSSNIDYTIVGNPTDLGCGDGNLSQNPLYSSTAQCDYTPAAGSPAYGAGPAGERIGWLGFPEASSCSLNSDCTDANPCTTDVCDSGVCSHEAIAGCTPCDTSADCNDGNPCTVDTCGVDGVCAVAPGNDGSACDDGIACTDDECSAGTCVGINACPSGLTCDYGTETCIAQPTTLTFQDNGGYAGTEDTYLAEEAAATAQGALDNWRWDLEGITGNAASRQYGLIRFNDVFGNGNGQIPVGSTVQSATLTLVIFNGSAAPAGEIREAAVDWTEAATTWNNFGGEAGVQTDELGASIAAAPIPAGTAAIDVTASLQSWVANPAANRGWIVVPASNDGIQVRSAEYATATDRPRLSVTFVPPAASTCVFDSDCDDGAFCNGEEQCVANVCTPGNPPDCDDGIACTPDVCDETADACVNSSCEMEVRGGGSRYLDVTPPASLAAVALRVSSPAVACLPKYIVEDGRLADLPVFRSSLDWGTVHVGDDAVLPATEYTVESEVPGGGIVASGSTTTWAWGDADDVQGVDVFDILCVLDGSQAIFGRCTQRAVDVASGIPNRTIDTADIDAVLDAFGGTSYPDADPCDGQTQQSTAAPAPAPDGPGGATRLEIVPRAKHVGASGGVVAVDVFVRGAVEIGAYRIAFESSGGRAAVESMTVDLGRGDFLFAGTTSYPSAETRRGRIGSRLRAGGAAVDGRAYLGTAYFRVPAGAGASGTIYVRMADTILMDPHGLAIPFEAPAAVPLSMAPEEDGR